MDKPRCQANNLNKLIFKHESKVYERRKDMSHTSSHLMEEINTMVNRIFETKLNKILLQKIS